MVAARCWWKDGVVYQVYPRSFADSNGDGVGDLGGLIDRLDHLDYLGVTMLWVTPFFASPNCDNGYDISDYCAVDPQQGTMADAERLIAECHRRGIRLILDFVGNHTSDQHPWFVESRATAANPKRDFYHWRKGRDGGPPNNWSAGFHPSAWQWDAATGEYYLHFYSVHMPDLCWENPAVRAELYRAMRFWLDRGVDGLRLDSINLIKKNRAFPDATTPDPATPGYYYDAELIYNQPGLLELLQEMRREVFDQYDMVAIGETSVTPSETASQFVTSSNRALDMVFNFEPVELERFDLPAFKGIQHRWNKLISDGGWISQYLSNHDDSVPEILERMRAAGRAIDRLPVTMFTGTMPSRGAIDDMEANGVDRIVLDVSAYDRAAYLGELDALQAAVA